MRRDGSGSRLTWTTRFAGALDIERACERLRRFNADVLDLAHWINYILAGFCLVLIAALGLLPCVGEVGMKGRHSSANVTALRAERDAAKRESERMRSLLAMAHKQLLEAAELQERFARTITNGIEVIETTVRNAIEVERAEAQTEREHTRAFLRRTLDVIEQDHDGLDVPIIKSMDDFALCELVKPGTIADKRDSMRNLRAPDGWVAATKALAEDDRLRRSPKGARPAAQALTQYSPLLRRYVREIDGREEPARRRNPEIERIIADGVRRMRSLAAIGEVGNVGSS